MLDAPIKMKFNFQLSTSLTGLSSLIPPFGTQIPHKLVIEKYREAITALSHRLGQDKWFLGSRWVGHTVSPRWGSNYLAGSPPPSMPWPLRTSTPH